MELREAVGLARDYFRVVLLGGAFLSLAAVLISLVLPKTYKASLTLYVQQQPQSSPGEFYSYDGYYAQQTAERFTRTVAGLLQDPGIVKTAAEKSGYPTDQRSLRAFSRAIKVRETAPQLVFLSVFKESSPSARKLVAALSAAAIQKVEILNKEGGGRLRVSPLDQEPLWEEQVSYPLLNGLVAFLAGVVLSLLGIALVRYLRSC